jgi:FkbM family methyltransferase
MRPLPASPVWAGVVALVASLVVAGCGPESRQGSASGRTAPIAARRDILGTGTKLYSLRDEELIIRDFFQDRRNGFFLDVGCAWPVKENNTFYLEKHLGWSGIAVDALPEYAQPWRKRPRSRFFNYLVSDHSDTVEPFYRADLPDVSSYRPPNNPGGAPARYEEIHVPTITLTKLLDGNGVSRIDFMSMDIEGAEPLALAGFDIARFRPELACVEAKGANRAAILAYFNGHGYRRIDRYLERDQVNYYFTPVGASPGP